MQKVGILGASGYSGEVLVELLLGHPKVKDLIVASSTHAGERVDKVLPRLAGRLGDLVFSKADPEALISLGADVWFLALPHGVAADYAIPLVESGALVIDLSADFRLNSPEVYESYYGHAHKYPDWLPRVPYVLPECPAITWKKAQLIACPGCYPTSILVPLLPLVKDGLLTGSGITVSAMSGVSGAGKKATLDYSYCERSESLKAYGVAGHRHLSEIEEQLGMVARRAIHIQFTPHLVPMMRGLAATTVVPFEGSIDSIYSAWNKLYANRPGVRLLPSGETPDTRNVLGRNRVDMSAVHDTRTGNLVITSALDNLVKGAGGQAIQIWNLRKGWPEQSGLS